MVLAWGDSKPGGIPSLGVPLAWGDPKPGGNTSLGDLSPGAFSMEILSPGSSAGEVLSPGVSSRLVEDLLQTRGSPDQEVPRPGGYQRGPKKGGPRRLVLAAYTLDGF